MAGLTRPITFTLAAPTTMMSMPGTGGLPDPTAVQQSNGGGGGGEEGGLQAVCSFWDEQANDGVGGYATEGCCSQPSPLPPNLTVAWVPGFEAHDPVMLAQMCDAPAGPPPALPVAGRACAA